MVSNLTRFTLFDVNHLAVLNADWASADHQKAAEAIKSGMKMRNAPSFLIHTSGAGILAAPDIRSGTFGTESTKVYNDWDGVSEVTSLPEDAAHRTVDKIVLSSNEESSLIRTAIVCPPCIYGEGRGPDKTRSIQVPELIKCTLERKKGFQIGHSQNRWGTVHVRDLSSIYLRLIEEASKPGGGNATWGLEGYYFIESGEHHWGDIARAIASEACKLGLIPSPEIEHLSVNEVEAIHPFGRYLWGTNSRHTAIRARRVLGWEPADSLSLSVELPRMVEVEARRMKLI